MKSFTLKSRNEEGVPLEATFAPEKGMNLLSYKLGNLEVIDQSTKGLFEKKFAGLGPLIGPHFHRRPLHLIPKGIDIEKFPHSAYFAGDERPDPFSHGIGRYAPWTAEFSDSEFQATLSGDDNWNGVPLSFLEGQNFRMSFKGALSSNGLALDLAVVSDTDSVVGIHYYYHLPNGRGTIESQVKKEYIVDNTMKPFPNEWEIDEQQRLKYPLEQNTDFTFFPYPNPLEGNIVLTTDTHKLLTSYQCASEENSWQLWHPIGASFVCVEPLSSQDPRHPNLTVSGIRIRLQIVPNNRAGANATNLK